MSRLFRRIGTRAAADFSDYEFEAPLIEELFERRVNVDPAQVAADVLLGRMLGDAGLTVADAGRDGVVVTLHTWCLLPVRDPDGRGTQVHALGWRVALVNRWITSPLVGVDLQAQAVSTKSGHAYRPELEDGLELAPALQDHPDYALRTWGFANVGP